MRTQRQQLEALEFKWVPHEVTWEAMFSALVQYKEQHGDCMVPVYGPENPALGMWVIAQRQRKDRLHATRRERLEKLGFVWNTFDTAWEKNFWPSSSTNNSTVIVTCRRSGPRILPLEPGCRIKGKRRIVFP